jgi:hypothetical protein
MIDDPIKQAFVEVRGGPTMKSVAEGSLELTSLFEAELFVRLLLERWSHPLGRDEEFCNGLLEGAATALREACAGTQLMEEIPAQDMNFVAAVWYTEHCDVENGGADVEEAEGRRAWLAAIRKAVPSCFCDPSDLQGP